MNFKEKLISVLEFLGFKQKFEDKSLSQEEFNAVVAEYQKKYQATLTDDLAAEQAARQTEQQAAEFQTMLNTIQSVLSGTEPTAAADNKEGEPQNQTQANATLEGILESIKGMRADFKAMAEKPTPDVPVQTVTASPLNVNGFSNTPQYLFGVEHPMFSMKDRWNKIAANPRAVAALPEVDEQLDGSAFYKAARNYAKSLKNRYLYLQQNKMLDAAALAKGTYATNYDGVDNAGLGDQFVVLRQDALIARVLQVRDLTQYFPVAYGYQDRALVFNSFFDEVSQAYQKGEVFKGGMKIENQMGYVDDAMMKLDWGPMKELERNYIGYLNKEDSDPIKWTMIEFQLLNSLKTGQVEQNKRRMRGIYIEPEQGIAGSYLNAATGLLYTLVRYVHQYDLKPHGESTYRNYTRATFLTAVQEFIADVRASITEDMDLDNHVVYLNKNHQDWWIKNVRSIYGKDTDFAGPMGALSVVPDTTMRIIWLPYLGQTPFMMIHEPGNIQFLENAPGEMLSMKMEERMEQVRAWSVWKEGTSASFTGRRFATKEEMDKNNYEWQQIFINLFAATITDKVDGNNGFWHITDSTTTQTTITNIENVKVGVAYCIECGDETKLPKITKSGKFDSITDDFTATAVGDYIMVIIGSDSKFRELERCVGGKRTINKKLQPNVPGAR
nr:MAG TPA: major capsid protein [Caudoviricetes sp.]